MPSGSSTAAAVASPQPALPQSLPEAGPSKPKSPAKEPANQTLIYFAAGGLAGAVSRTVVSPLERLKILQQVQQRNSSGQTTYRGIWSSLVLIWRKEGWRGYFRGNGINCVRVVAFEYAHFDVLRIAPYSAVQFTAYERFKKARKIRQLDTPLRLSAGALAGICSVTSTYPLDLVRSRLSIATAAIGSTTNSIYAAQDLSIVGMTKKVYREEGGIRALYRGMVPTALGVAPYVGINFAAYEALRAYASPPGEQPGTITKLACTLTYPIDVLRRKMQVIGVRSLGAEYSSAWGAMRWIWQKEGLRGLYVGIWANLLKLVRRLCVRALVAQLTIADEATKNALSDL